jgi:ribonuclease G
VKGRAILIEPLARGGHAAALMVDGRLEDLLIDPAGSEAPLAPGSVHLARIGRPMKGMGGAMVDLGNGRSGFLREPRGLSEGALRTVQVTAWAEPGKAPPVTPRVALRGRLAVVTPGMPGRNIARGIADDTARRRLSDLAERAMTGAPADLGLILRSAAAAADEAELINEINALRTSAETVRELSRGRAPGLLLAAPGAARDARRDWREGPADLVDERAGAFADHGIWEEIAAFSSPRADLPGGGFLLIEPTRALVAVDVNTGPDTSPAAALKANIEAARALPRQLRLRGLAGQVVVDPAPLARRDRQRVEQALGAALRGDPIETSLAGWTPLGHIELLRKRARRPLAEAALAPLL